MESSNQIKIEIAVASLGKLVSGRRTSRIMPCEKQQRTSHRTIHWWTVAYRKKIDINSNEVSNGCFFRSRSSVFLHSHVIVAKYICAQSTTTAKKNKSAKVSKIRVYEKLYDFFFMRYICGKLSLFLCLVCMMIDTFSICIYTRSVLRVKFKKNGVKNHMKFWSTLNAVSSLLIVLLVGLNTMNFHHQHNYFHFSCLHCVQFFFYIKAITIRCAVKQTYAPFTSQSIENATQQKKRTDGVSCGSIKILCDITELFGAQWIYGILTL